MDANFFIFNTYIFKNLANSFFADLEEASYNNLIQNIYDHLINLINRFIK